MGYNSLRLPFTLPLFQSGDFQFLDKCIDWCEEEGIYVFLDLYGALEEESAYNKIIALWEKIAERYEQRWIVGGYDILSEPPGAESPGYINCGLRLPKLAEFYREAVCAIRAKDKNHLISEGIGSKTLSWKKMSSTNSQYSIRKPKNWDAILSYVNACVKPEKAAVAAMFDEYLNNIQLQNCLENINLTNAIFRRPAFILGAGDFDTAPAKPASPQEKSPLKLTAGESVSYTVCMTESGDTVRLTYFAAPESHFTVFEDGRKLGSVDTSVNPGISAAPNTSQAFALVSKREAVIKIEVDNGEVSFIDLRFSRPFKDAKYQGGAQNIPGRVMVAYYDFGGEGLAYHDSDAVNHGSGELTPIDGTYRNGFRANENVDTTYTKFQGVVDNSPYNFVEPEPDMLYVGWNHPGEWTTYTVNVEESGDYKVKLMFASWGGGACILDFDGMATLCKFPSTFVKADPIEWRQWHHWNKVDAAKIHLESGLHILTVKIVEGAMNYAYFDFSLSQ
jgi:hypothetical protein